MYPFDSQSPVHWMNPGIYIVSSLDSELVSVQLEELRFWVRKRGIVTQTVHSSWRYMYDLNLPLITVNPQNF